MIQVSFSDNSFRMTGHAGFAAVGQDVVCAAASMLAYTVAFNVWLAGRDGKLESPCEIRMQPGDVRISCRPKEESREEIRLLFAYMHRGYDLLAKNYPDNVVIQPAEAG